MSDTLDALKTIMERNYDQSKVVEEQRTAMTGIVVVIASAIQGALTQTGLNKSSLPLTLMLIILGVFGSLATIKLYERFSFHIHRCDTLRIRLDELYPEAHIMKILNTSDSEHEVIHPIIGVKIRLHRIWLILHILIATLGVVYTLIALLK